MTRLITTLGATVLAEVGRLGRTGMFLGQTLLDTLTLPFHKPATRKLSR